MSRHAAPRKRSEPSRLTRWEWFAVGILAYVNASGWLSVMDVMDMTARSFILGLLAASTVALVAVVVVWK